MTLLITVATNHGLSLSSDYRLSNNGRIIETVNGAKQLSVSGIRRTTQISFTGVVSYGNRYHTRKWLGATISSLPVDAPMENLIDAICTEGTAALRPIRHHDNRLTIVIGTVEDRQCRLFMISNWESLFGPVPPDRDLLRSCEINISRPRVLIHGNVAAVPRYLRKWIEHLAARLSSPSERIASALATVNKHAAGRSHGTISEGCWVQSLLLSGETFGRNYGSIPGLPASIHGGGFDVGQWVGTEFPAAPGKKLTIEQSWGFRGRPTPAPTEVGEVRSIRLVSPANTVSITAGAGGPLLATLSFSGIALGLAVRKNLYASTSLGTVTLLANPETLGSATPFQVKRARLSCLPTVDGAQPNSWDYTFNLDFDGSKLALTVLQNSTALRSMYASKPLQVLQDAEELLMVAPIGGLTLSVTPSFPQASASLEAHFLLRDFPELQLSR